MSFSIVGTMNGWLSPALPELLSEQNTPLTTGPLTNEQLSWIGSINALSGIFGTFSLGCVTAYWGCKRAALLLSITCFAFWTLIFFGDSYYHVLIARFCMGTTGGGVQTTIILYISEISNNEYEDRRFSWTNALNFRLILYLQNSRKAQQYFVSFKEYRDSTRIYSGVNPPVQNGSMCVYCFSDRICNLVCTSSEHTILLFAKETIPESWKFVKVLQRLSKGEHWRCCCTASRVSENQSNCKWAKNWWKNHIERYL